MNDKKYTEEIAKNIGKKLRGKQTALKFDNTPTEGSVNPVTSEGIKTYIDEHAGEVYKAGSGISIQNNKIINTSPGKIYTAGDGIDIQNNEIINTSPGEIYTAGKGIEITENNIIYKKTYPIRGIHPILNKSGNRTNARRIPGGNASNVGTDGNNIYYSGKYYYDYQYVFDKNTCNGTNKIGNNLTSFEGRNVGLWGGKIYYSNGDEQYVLNVETSTGNTIIWQGLTDFYGYNIGTNGNNVYYSNGSEQYIYDKDRSRWVTKYGYGLTNFSGSGIWTDGNNIYYSNLNKQYVLNKNSNTPHEGVTKTGTGLEVSLFGSGIWTDDKNIYYSYGSNHYILDNVNLTGIPIEGNGVLSNFSGSGIWTDGDNIYCLRDSEGISHDAILYILRQPLSIKPLFGKKLVS